MGLIKWVDIKFSQLSDPSEWSAKGIINHTKVLIVVKYVFDDQKGFSNTKINTVKPSEFVVFHSVSSQ